MLTNYKAVLKSIFASSNIRAMFCFWARRGRMSCIASIHIPQQYWPVALLPEALEKSNIGKNLLYFDFLFREGSLDSVISLQSSLCKQSQKQQTVALQKKKKVNNHLIDFSKHLTCSSQVLNKKRKKSIYSICFIKEGKNNILLYYFPFRRQIL